MNSINHTNPQKGMIIKYLFIHGIHSYYTYTKGTKAFIKIDIYFVIQILLSWSLMRDEKGNCFSEKNLGSLMYVKTTSPFNEMFSYRKVKSYYEVEKQFVRIFTFAFSQHIYL